MRSSRMRGYGSWTIGWREGERLPPGPSQGPGCLFWGFIAVLLYTCVQVAIQGHPFALLLGLAILIGAVKGMKS
jgi:hypothetical protein